MSTREQGSILLILSLVLAFVLTLMPLPQWLSPFRPYWVALIVIYWNLEAGRLRQLGQAFVLGLLLDLATGTLLGQHALGLVIMVFSARTVPIAYPVLPSVAAGSRHPGAVDQRPGDSFVDSGA